jgi:hypothetical protein
MSLWTPLVDPSDQQVMESISSVSTVNAWPPQRGQKITFRTLGGVKEGVLQEVRWGLVWRDFFLEDGRVVPEHAVLGRPEPQVWRDPNSVSVEEREAWEEWLLATAEAGIDPQDREGAFWADLTQYLAFTYLRFKASAEEPHATWVEVQQL